MGGRYSDPSAIEAGIEALELLIPGFQIDLERIKASEWVRGRRGAAGRAAGRGALLRSGTVVQLERVKLPCSCRLPVTAPSVLRRREPGQRWAGVQLWYNSWIAKAGGTRGLSHIRSFRPSPAPLLFAARPSLVHLQTLSFPRQRASPSSTHPPPPPSSERTSSPTTLRPPACTRPDRRKFTYTAHTPSPPQPPCPLHPGANRH
jgi:hypothetical protein